MCNGGVGDAPALCQLPEDVPEALDRHLFVDLVLQAKDAMALGLLSGSPEEGDHAAVGGPLHPGGDLFGDERLRRNERVLCCHHFTAA